MKKTVKVTLIVSVVLVAAGLLFASIGFFAGAHLGIYVGDSGFYTDSGAFFQEENHDLPPFTCVNIDVEIAEVEILPGTAYGIEMGFYGENRKMTYQIDQGVLQVTGGKHNRQWRLFGFNLGFLKPKTNIVKIYVPQETLNEISVETDLGDITIQGIQTRSLTCISHLGAVKVENITTQACRLQLDMGSLHVFDSRLGNASIENHMGDFQGKGISTTALDCEMNMGKVDIAGAFSGITQVDADMGEVKIVLSDGISGYDIDVHTNMGSVYLDGEDMGTRYRTSTESANQVTVDSSMGNVKITTV